MIVENICFKIYFAILCVRSLHKQETLNVIWILRVLVCLRTCGTSEGQICCNEICVPVTTYVTIRTAEVWNFYVNLNVIINSSSPYEYLQNGRVKLCPNGGGTCSSASKAKKIVYSYLYLIKINRKHLFYKCDLKKLSKYIRMKLSRVALNEP
jgi:hypothetical protein